MPSDPPPPAELYKQPVAKPARSQSRRHRPVQHLGSGAVPGTPRRMSKLERARAFLNEVADDSSLSRTTGSNTGSANEGSSTNSRGVGSAIQRTSTGSGSMSRGTSANRGCQMPPLVVTSAWRPSRERIIMSL
mmetsp:Transcript_112849/g.351805  ORF Transcript_112849/g.351805 Transcript_112849/m.351805 type:complete len:133 (-) Transcript_112849:14-412(-)